MGWGCIDLQDGSSPELKTREFLSTSIPPGWGRPGIFESFGLAGVDLAQFNALIPI
jgi:hypothetical protein